MNVPQKILSRAADFFEKHPTRWTKGVYARDKKGRATELHSHTAHCFCLVGRLEKESAKLRANRDDLGAARTRVNQTLQLTWKIGLTHWNDAPQRTVKQVVRALRQAAAK
jgi:hypothetical protein